jgi:hypothetical protein
MKHDDLRFTSVDPQIDPQEDRLTMTPVDGLDPALVGTSYTPVQNQLAVLRNLDFDQVYGVPMQLLTGAHRTLARVVDHLRSLRDASANGVELKRELKALSEKQVLVRGQLKALRDLTARARAAWLTLRQHHGQKQQQQSLALQQMRSLAGSIRRQLLTLRASLMQLHQVTRALFQQERRSMRSLPFVPLNQVANK